MFYGNFSLPPGAPHFQTKARQTAHYQHLIVPHLFCQIGGLINLNKSNFYMIPLLQRQKKSLQLRRPFQLFKLDYETIKRRTWCLLPV